MTQRQKAIVLGYLLFGIALQVIAAFLTGAGEGPDAFGAVFGAPISILPVPGIIPVWWAAGYWLAKGRLDLLRRGVLYHVVTAPLAVWAQLHWWYHSRVDAWWESVVSHKLDVALLLLPYVAGLIVTAIAATIDGAGTRLRGADAGAEEL